MLAHLCPNLSTLEVAGCSQFTDTGFQALARSCRFLEKMDLEECALITDATLIHLAMGCPRLEKLVKFIEILFYFKNKNKDGGCGNDEWTDYEQEKTKENDNVTEIGILEGEKSVKCEEPEWNKGSTDESSLMSISKSENRLETSKIVDDWDETNDSQQNVESKSDGPSRPDFF